MLSLIKDYLGLDPRFLREMLIAAALSAHKSVLRRGSRCIFRLEHEPVTPRLLICATYICNIASHPDISHLLRHAFNFKNSIINLL